MMAKAAKRPERTPIHKQRTLTMSEADKDPNFVYRIVNEEVGRIDKFLKAGWAPVVGDVSTGDTKVQDASPIDSTVRRVVNRDRDANAHTAILMRIPKEYYTADQADKQKDVDYIESSYDPEFQSKDGTTYGSMDKSYN